MEDAKHYSMLIEWDPDDKIYVVTVPELEGCMTHGHTYEEARRGSLGFETSQMRNPLKLPWMTFPLVIPKPNRVAIVTPLSRRKRCATPSRPAAGA